MIFNCPACDAGHTVPASMIPNGGLEQACRRCGAAFLAMPDGEVAAASAPVVRGAEDVARASAAGEARRGEGAAGGKDLGSAPVMIGREDEGGFDGTLAEPEAAPDHTTRDPAPGFGDGPSSVTESAFGDGEATVEASAEIATLADPAEGDSELDATQRLPSDVGGLPTVEALNPEPPRPSDKTPVLDLEVHPAALGAAPMGDAGLGGARSDPDLATPSSVYDLVASGDYAPPEKAPVETSAADEGPKAWNEPSDPKLRAQGAAPKFVRLVNGAPLPVKVALLVFPLALGVTLLLTAADDGEGPPIEIPTQRPVAVVDPGEAPAAEGADRAARSSDPHRAPDPAPPPRLAEVASTENRAAGDVLPPPEGLSEDRPAPDGYLFTQKTLRVRPRADAEAKPTARLSRGRLVRLYETRGPWTLVLFEPDGPAGFVPRAELAETRPISALADAIAFEGCARRGRSRAARRACRDRADQQLGDCNLRCGDGLDVDPDGPEGRCRAACKEAFDLCRAGCRKRR